MTLWTQNLARDRWTYDARWSVVRRGGRWWVESGGLRANRPFRALDLAKALAEKMIAAERELPEMTKEFLIELADFLHAEGESVLNGISPVIDHHAQRAVRSANFFNAEMVVRGRAGGVPAEPSAGETSR